jgi:UDP-2,3-diacylglucosamine hydrolase
MSALAPGKKIYFISDFHLGIPDREKSLEREKKIVRWLDSIRHDAQVLFLMGDVFDYWFEYSEAVPKGYVRLLGKLAELSDSGIELHYFTGNHDMWVFDYFTQEMGIQIHRDTIVKEYNGKSFFLGHGDGLGPSDHGYKLIKSVFANPACQWLFARIHPNTGIRIMKFFSRKSRLATGGDDGEFKGEENEWLVLFCKDQLARKHFDFFIFGHRHLPLDITLNGSSRYINLGEWLHHCMYAEFDGKDLRLLPYSN